MKKSIVHILALMAMLAGSSAFGSSTSYYASLTTKVANGCSGMGKVYASTDPNATSGADSAVGEGSSTEGSASVTVYGFATANAGYEFKGWAESADGSNPSGLSPYTYKVTSSDANKPPTDPDVIKTIYGVFAKLSYPAFSVTYLAPVGGGYTVDGESVGGGGLVKGPFTEVYTPKLVATAAEGYAFNGWYTIDGSGAKTPLSQEVDYTAAFTAATTVGADFVKSVTVTTAEELLYSLEHDTLMEIPSGVTITIESGTLANGKTLIVNGDLFLSGTFTNNGTVKGGGRISTYTKQVTQTGVSGDTPFETTCVSNLLNKAYYKTAITALNGKFSGNTPTCARQNAAKVVRNDVTIAQCVWPTSVTPAVLCCTVDPAKAVNCITGFLNPCYDTDAAKGMATMKKNGQQTKQTLVLLATTKLDNTACSNAGLLVKIGNYNKMQGNFGTMDLAGSTLTISPSYIDNYTHTLLNGGLSVTTLMYSGTLNCINLSSLSLSKLKEDYASVVNIYDCNLGTKVPKAYNGSNANKNKVNFYSSGDNIYSTSSNFHTQNPTTVYKIYGGRWKEKPSDDYIAEGLKSDYAFYQTSETDTSYSLKKKSDMSVVQFDDGTKFESLADAFAALPSMEASSVTMTMLKNAELASAVTVPAGKTVELELNGMCITAANGFVVNNGTFRIGDGTGNLASTGGRVLVSSGYLLQNAGEAEITYGYYTGKINLAGGKMITHHGYFTGAITAADKSYADLRGGCFTQNVTALLADGYYQRSNYVGPFPKPAVSCDWISSNGGYWRYSMKTLVQSDLDLYNSSSSTKGDYSPENWKRRAEVISMVTPYLNYVVDIGVGFDRSIAAGSATARITKPVGISQDLDKDVAAGELYRVFSPYFVSQGTSQKRYSAFLATGVGLEDFQNTVFGISTTTAGNYGTTVDLRIDLCTGPDTSLTSVYALMSEYVVLGAGKTNQAMIQPASGAATFYATIAAAVAAAPEGATIKLCNNITATDTITISKAVTIETNGLEFKGTFEPGLAYKMEVVETVLDVEKQIGKKHIAYTFTPAVARINETDYPTLAAAVDAVGANDEIILLADCAEKVKTTKAFGFTINAKAVVFTGSVDGAGEFTLVDEGEGMYAYKPVKFVPQEGAGAIQVGGKVVAVTKEWVASNVTGANPPSAADVNAALSASQENGLTGFQNYMVGVAPTRKNPLAPARGQAKETGAVVITTLAPVNPPKIKTGFVAKYCLLKATYDAKEGKIGAFEQVQELPIPEFPIEINTLVPETYWKIKTIITPTPSND